MFLTFNKYALHEWVTFVLEGHEPIIKLSVLDIEKGKTHNLLETEPKKVEEAQTKTKESKCSANLEELLTTLK